MIADVNMLLLKLEQLVTVLYWKNVSSVSRWCLEWISPCDIFYLDCWIWITLSSHVKSLPIIITGLYISFILDMFISRPLYLSHRFGHRNFDSGFRRAYKETRSLNSEVVNPYFVDTVAQRSTGRRGWGWGGWYIAVVPCHIPRRGMYHHWEKGLQV